MLIDDEEVIRRWGSPCLNRWDICVMTALDGKNSGGNLRQFSGEIALVILM
ncbi:MAG: hypothetical protein R2860_16005 [Desulfobacterales bacterium]